MATSRLETMLGDVAVAVHPDDRCARAVGARGVCLSHFSVTLGEGSSSVLL